MNFWEFADNNPAVVLLSVLFICAAAFGIAAVIWGR